MITPLYIRYLSWSTNIILKMQLKTLLYLISIVKIMCIEKTYLRVLSHELRKLEWIWYIFQYSIYGVIYFQSTNCLLLFGYINLELMKDCTLLIKILKLMIYVYPKSYKIIYQVSVQTLVCVCISITSCKNNVIYFKGSDIFSLFIL